MPDLTKKTKISLVAIMSLCLLFLVQIGLGFGPMLRYEHILQTGDELRLVTRPIDPYDFFRGRYVTLAYEVNRKRLKRKDFGITDWGGGKYYVSFTPDEKGNGAISAVSREKPASGIYLKCSITTGGRLKIPYSRFYMNEKLARPAENIMRRAGKDKRAVAVLKVRDGKAIIKDVEVEGKGLAAYVREQLEKK